MGGELLRLLVSSSLLRLVYVHSNSQKGKTVAKVHPDWLDSDGFQLTRVRTEELKPFFLGLPHGKANTFLEKNRLASEMSIIDLSTDFQKLNRMVCLWTSWGEKSRFKELSGSNSGMLATAIQCFCSNCQKLGEKSNSISDYEYWCG